MPRLLLVALLVACSFSTGCAGPGQILPGLKSPAQDWQVKSVDSHWQVGPEMRENNVGEDANRWTAQTGLEATTHNGHKIGVSYRRRDIDNGMGRNDGNDNGVWLTWSIPVWKDTSRADKEKQTDKEKELERRVADLEKRLSKLEPTD